MTAWADGQANRSSGELLTAAVSAPIHSKLTLLET